MAIPSSEEFLVQARTGRPQYLIEEMLADMETPLGAYWKLAYDEPYSFLLESVTGGEQLGRYSVLGVRPRAVFRSKNGTVFHDFPGGNETLTLKPGTDPLDLLKEALGELPPEIPAGLPRFAGGAVGMLSYDIVRYFEKLPDTCTDDLNVDDMAMMLTSAVVVFDHAKNIIKIVARAEPSKHGYESAVSEIERIKTRLLAPVPPLPNGKYAEKETTSNVTKEHFESMVSRMVTYITAGDGVQMVPAQRFEKKVEAHPLTVYRALRNINPSPYMFLFRFIDFDLVGASPEFMVSLHNDVAHLRPIAGTRWRGIDEAEDLRLEKELLADEKERAEHVMLVDLARNDLGRVCEFGSVTVNELMVVERYSHVMHIVSDVTGQIRKDRDAYDLIRACFPAGTVSGAPKVRAMQIIDELEPTRRGLYAGAVGFISDNGDTDTCIAIRSIYLKDGRGYVQAGGGVVYDSTPELEYQESKNKAKACLSALDRAETGL